MTTVRIVVKTEMDQTMPPGVRREARRSPSPGIDLRSAGVAARLTGLGLTAVAVDRCPVVGCEVCDRSKRRAA